MNILIVDDREDNRYLLEALLKGNRHDVQSAANGAEALERLKAGGVELIISDILMPVMDGFQLCRKVKTDEALRHIPFIIYTATYTGPQDEAFAMKIGADRFIQKPCEPDVFMEAVRDVLAAAKGRDTASMPVHEEEMLKLYSERLVRKLEQKMLELEKEVRIRREVEEELRTSERKYRMLADNTLDVIWAMDLDLAFTYVNPAIRSLTGHSVKEWIGSQLSEHCDEENLAKMKQIIAEEMARGPQSSGVILEAVLLNKNRTPIRVEIHGKVIYDEHERPVGLQGVTRDIWERKEAEETLRESERKFRLLAESIQEVFWISTPAVQEMIYISPAYEKIWGRSCESLYRSPKSFLDAVHLDDRPKLLNVIAKHHALGKPYTCEYRIVSSAGETRWIFERGFPAYDENNALLYMTGVCIDISERMRAESERLQLEEKLRQAQKMEAIGTLAGGIAHDFNNILSAILGYTELALDDVKEQGQLEANLREVHRAGIRAKDLVKQILTFARKTEGEIKPVQVHLVAKEVMKFLRSSIPTSIELKHNLESKSFVMADPTQIYQVIMNLCTNAAQAMEVSGGILEFALSDVTVGAGRPGEPKTLSPGKYLKMTVSDTGTGIAEKDLDAIFDPYFTTKGPGEGTGLGLAVVHGVAKGLKGEITVQSEIGKGSVFTIYLPIARTQPIADQEYEREDLPSGTERILFVDDEPAIVSIALQTLERLGYTVTTRVSSGEALDLFRSHPDRFDLVITDMTMPKMTGDKLAGELIAIRPDVPVILCTGYNAKMSEEKAKGLGIKAFVMKPLVKKDLANTVRKVLDAK
jgi:PAS domain S-box-containing protein